MSKVLSLFMAVLMVVSCSKKDDEAKAVENANLTIISQDGTKTAYSVEEAVTKEQLETGLMGRDSLPEKHGMIFNLKDFPEVAMWMKDTKIPLDMVFVYNGEVVWLFENAKPLSTDTILCPVKANAVIEINAGEVKKFNIKVGDKVEHAFFANMAAPANEAPIVVEESEEVEVVEPVAEEAEVPAALSNNAPTEMPVAAEAAPAQDEVAQPANENVEPNVGQILPAENVEAPVTPATEAAPAEVPATESAPVAK